MAAALSGLAALNAAAVVFDAARNLLYVGGSFTSAGDVTVNRIAAWNGGDGYVGVFSPTKATMREPFVDAVVEKLKADLARGIVTTAARLDGRISRL